MKKIIKYLTRVLIATLVMIFIWVIFNWENISNFPNIISSFYAKEFCSCYYVMGLPEEQCHHYTKQYISISDFKIDKEKKTVTVSGLGKTNTAFFENSRVGCRLK